ncbi:PREDICTED: uncharacterized protein LOC108565077 [Nicrophorus vespilloides]|uniref:Uncharacterized protein LOC108565077 n=1 Tax=Nicrophorus vespilloides TaxID=110193 RepID=A0ABM1MZ44_NICVS|nr:PREDICTED: uncharacterized protein LOC108565077 [Nicrophorus vespilloides]
MTEDQIDDVVPEFIKENYNIHYEPAIPGTRRNSGGILICDRKSIDNFDYIDFVPKSSDISVLKFGIDEQHWQFITVYSRQNRFIRDIYHPLKSIMEESGNDDVLIMGDFNIRIGSVDGKTSQDKLKSRYSRILRFKDEHSLTFLNGTLSDSRGKFTRHSDKMRNTVLDYMLIKKQSTHYVFDFDVDDSMRLSDHIPLCTNISNVSTSTTTSNTEYDVSTTSDKEDDISTTSDKEDDVSTTSDKEDDVSTTSDEQGNVYTRYRQNNISNSLIGICGTTLLLIGTMLLSKK